ncbi:MAG: Spy/CpxP family protein refolding chaperone [Bryobacteraceae bacterium]|jgi:Spy/CpxP family protein refolding chaperone
MKILLLFAVGASFLAAQQTTAPTRPDWGRRGGAPPSFEQRLTQRLGLTAEQQNSIHTIIAEREVILRGNREQMQTLNKSLTAAIKTGNTSEIDSLSQQMASLHQQQIAQHSKSVAKMYAALTAEQQAKVGANLEMLRGPGEFMPRPGPGRGPGGPRPGGPAPPAAQ